MASVIKLKRSSTSGSVPTTGDLQTGEVAVNLFDRKLYVSNGAGVTAIGGEDFRLTSQSPSAGAGAYLKLLGDTSSTSNTVLLRGGTGISVARDGNGSIAFTSTLGGDIDSKMDVANTQSLVNARLGATATVTLTGDVTASATAFSSNAVSISTSLAADSVDTAELVDDAVTNAKIADNAVTLGTQTTGNYVATAAAGNNSIVITGSGSESASLTVSLGDNIGANTSGKAATAGNADTATALETARTIGGVSFDGTANINLPGVNTTGNQDTSGSAATLTTARDFAVSGDVTASAVSFDGSGNVTLATSLASGVVDTAELADGAVTSAKIAAGGITANAIGDNSVALGTKTSGNYVATVSGTANEIEVSGSGSETAAVTIGLPDDVTVAAQLNVGENLVVTGNTSIGGELTVDGDLTVTGATTYLSSSTITIDDGMFKLSANNAGDVTDTGVYAKYVVSGNSAVQYAGYFRDATDGEFKFYTGLDAEPTSTVNVSDTGYSLATINAVIDGGSY